MTSKQNEKNNKKKLKSSARSVFNKNFIIKNKNILIFVLCIIAYFQTLSFNLVYCDDHSIIITYFDRINDISNLINEFFKGYIETDYYRPFINLSFVINAQFGGQESFSYHLVNVLLHFVMCISVFTLIKELKYSNNKAFLVSIIYAVHPLFTNSVAWIVGRNDILYSIFCIWSFIFFIRYKELNHNKNLIIHLILLLFAFFSKETALIFPVVIMSFILLREKKNFFSSKNLKIYFLWIILIIFWILLRSISELGENVNRWGLDVIFYNLPQIPEYVSKFILPIKLSVLPTYNDFNTIIGIILIFLLTFIIIFKKQKRIDYIFFGIGFYLILIIPGLFVTLLNSADWNDYLETRAYLPTLGLIIVLLELVDDNWLNLKNKKNLIALTFIIIFLTFLTFSESKKYEDSISFYKSAVENEPSRSLFSFLLAKSNNSKGNIYEAEKYFLKSIELKPNYWKYHSDLGDFYYQIKRFSDAEKYLDKTIELDSTCVNAYITLAKTYSAQKKIDKAIETWKNVLILSKSDEKIHENLVYLYLLKGDIEEANIHTEHLFQSNYDLNLIYRDYYNIGLNYYKRREFDSALILWNKAIKINPKEKEVYANLFLHFYAIVKDYDKANYYADELLKRGKSSNSEIMKIIEDFKQKQSD